MADMPPLSPVTGTPDQSAEATNAVVLNQQMGKLVDALSSSGADVVAAIDAITAAVTASIIGGTTGTTDNRLLRAKGTGGFALENCLVACDDSGNLTGARSIVLTNNTAYAVLCGGTTTSNPIQSVASVGTAGQRLTSNGAGALPTFQTTTLTDCFSFFITTVVNQDYMLVRIPFACTIVSTTTICTSGTCTVVTKINTTAVTSLSNSASSSEVTTTATGANTFAANDDIRITVSANSACVNLSVTIAFTRVI